MSQQEAMNHFAVTTVSREGGADSYYMGKRILDFVIALIACILLAPAMLLIAIAIKLDSPGPALFKQARVGARRAASEGTTQWETRTFTIYKFRTMFQNADPTLHKQHVQAFVSGELKPTKDKGAAFKLTNDPRVTRLGRILRKTSLDELPQLFNVLKGDISIVGPRPVPVYEVASYQPWHRERLAALPGITGLWQVNGRCALSFDEMIRLDIEYVRRQSLWLDLKIMLMTIPAVLSGRGAE